MNVIKFYVILWRILAIIGLNFLRYRPGSKEKYFRVFFIIGYVLLLTYFVATSLYFVRRQRYKESILVFILPLYSGLLWYFSYSRKKSISYVVSEVYHFKKHYSASNKTIHCITISLTIIIPTLHCVVCILNQTMMNFETFDLELWTFGIEIHNTIWKRILIFYIDFADFAFGSVFIFHLTICLFYKCSEMLTEYKEILQNHLQKGTTTDNNDYFLKFFYIVKFLRKLSETFSHLSFLIVAYYLISILYILLRISKGEMQMELFILLLLSITLTAVLLQLCVSRFAVP